MTLMQFGAANHAVAASGVCPYLKGTFKATQLQLKVAPQRKNKSKVFLQGSSSTTPGIPLVTSH